MDEIIITGPGFYRQRSGRKAEVLAERNGTWYGVGLDGAAEYWQPNGQWWEKGNLTSSKDLVAVWEEPTPLVPDVGEGWRLLTDHEMITEDDQFAFAADVQMATATGREWRGWLSAQGYVGETPLEVDVNSFAGERLFRRRVESPKPVPSDFLTQVAREAERAVSLHGEFNSLHEAYAVILEEVEEFWDEVRRQPAHRVDLDAYNELVQIAACCVKASHFLKCGLPKGRSDT